MNWKIRQSKKQAEQVVFALIAAFFLAGCNADDSAGRDQIETAFVDSILTTLTVQDKVGEMTQLTLGALAVGSPYDLVEPQQLDTAKVRRAPDGVSCWQHSQLRKP